jgi:hypothetical protein
VSGFESERDTHFAVYKLASRTYRFVSPSHPQRLNSGSVPPALRHADWPSALAKKLKRVERRNKAASGALAVCDEAVMNGERASERGAHR